MATKGDARETKEREKQIIATSTLLEAPVYAQDPIVSESMDEQQHFNRV